MAFKKGTATILDHPLDIHLIDFKAVVHDNFSTYSDETWKCQDKIIAQFKFCGCSNPRFTTYPNYPGWGHDGTNTCNLGTDASAHIGHFRSAPGETNFHTSTCNIACVCVEPQVEGNGCSGCVCFFHNSWASTSADGFLYFFDLCESFQNQCQTFWSTGAYGLSHYLEEYDLTKTGYFLCDRYCTAKGFGITQNPGT